jgi:hypothetical protein
MTNPLCEKCKPVEIENKHEIAKEKGCDKLYQAVDLCMKKYGGNISSCKVEWADFSACFQRKT